MTKRRVAQSERGQTLVLFVIVISLVFMMAAIAIDYGFWLSERRGLARASDLAALAAVQDLPEDATAQEYTQRAGACAALVSCDSAHVWAERNGYGESSGAVVTVQYFCANDIDNPPDDICTNENKDFEAFPLSLCPSAPGEGGCDTIRVIVEKQAGNLFGSFFGGVDFDIGSSAFAKVEFVVSPLDLAIAIDSSQSMSVGCGGGPVCPIEEARVASSQFVTTVLGNDPDTSQSQIGYAPYTFCYDDDDADECIPSIPLPPNGGDCDNPGPTLVVCLTNDAELLLDSIDNTEPFGFTNVCLGLWAAGAVLDGPNSRADVDRFIVILTDGDNVYEDGPGIPPECIPEGAGACGGAGPNSTRLNRCTTDVADDLKAMGFEIYVVGLNVEGSDPQPDCLPADPGNVGDSDAREMLKDIASSGPGTNDHYFETDNAEDLTCIFQGIAFEIAARGLTAAGD